LHGDTGDRRYLVADVKCQFGIKVSDDHGQRILYARVSSAKQKEDLERQCSDLLKLYPEHTILLKDVGSGVNFKRRGLQALLDRVYKGVVKEVVVMHKDRLARIGCELLEFTFEKFGTKLVVHSQSQDDSDEHDDLMSIISVFVASHHGKRGAENRKRRREEDEIKEGEVD
jgi:predicted site-specific integrase-resolvase